MASRWDTSSVTKSTRAIPIATIEEAKTLRGIRVVHSQVRCIPRVASESEAPVGAVRMRPTRRCRSQPDLVVVLGNHMGCTPGEESDKL